MSGDNEQVLLGKVVAAHGIKGQLRVLTFSGESDTLRALKSVILKTPQGVSERFSVRAVAGHGKKVIVALEGFSEINQVLHLVGREIYANRSQLPELPPGEYYWCDLVGLSVQTVEGLFLGKLTEILSTGSSDVYVVQGEEKEVLIPAVEDIVVQIDLDAGMMTVDPPEGLLDL